MARFIRHLLLFFSVLFIGISILPSNSSIRFKGLPDDCLNRASWIYNRIHENRTDIDIAFLGSSHTITGINDSLIYHSFGNELEFANLDKRIKTKY